MNKIHVALTSLVTTVLLLLAACSQAPTPATPEAPLEEPTLTAQASSATICVIGGDCHPSLQAAITAANAGDTINLGAGVDTEAGIVITKNLTIRGQGVSESIVQAAASPVTANDRVFVVNGGVTATLEDLTVRNGYINNDGGGIYNNGSLTLKRVTVRDNWLQPGGDEDCARETSECIGDSGRNGGGIFNNGSLTIINSTLFRNTAGKGGNVLNCPTGVDYYAGDGGSSGGIHNERGALTIVNSTLSGNRAGLVGGCSGSGTCGSGKEGEGGGIKSQEGTVTIINSTLSGNLALGGGGGIQIAFGTLSIRSSTITGNSAPGGVGGGLWNFLSTVSLVNTIVAGNTAAGSEVPDCEQTGGSTSSLGNNLVGTGTGCPSGGTGDLTTSNVSSVLNTTLADNGGPTFTHALVAGSPAINASNPAAAGSGGTACELTDQRVFLRPDRCDIGASEFNGTPDRTPPDTSITAQPTNPTNSPDASFSFTSSDSGSGIERFECFLDGIGWVDCSSPKAYSGLSEGSHTFHVRAIDNANNKDATPAIYTWVTSTDSTPPIITPNLSGTLGTNDWYTSDVSVSWTVVDEESTVSNQTGCDAVTVSADTAGTTFTCEATSAGGSSTQSVTVKRDATAPRISFAARTPANGAGWNNTDVTLNWNCTDATSGVINANVSQTASSEGANQSSTGTCTDNAGNTASDTQTGINIDKTAPTLNPVVSPTPVLLNASATVVSNASDSLSGLASQSCAALVTNSVGGKSVACSATDNAGNSASANASYSVIYNFRGFLTPVQNAPALNQVKAGWIVPFSFNLGGNFGRNVITSTVSVPINCSTLAPQGSATATQQGSTSLQDAEQARSSWAVSSTLTSSSRSTLYIYLWRTDKAWKNTCRQFTLTLNDGTQHKANFKFK